MPLLKAAQKANRQNSKRRQRNKHYKSITKNRFAKFLDLAKTDKTEAEKMLPSVFSALAVAFKKNLVSKNTMSRRQARAVRELRAAPEKVAEKKATKKATKKTA